MNKLYFGEATKAIASDDSSIDLLYLDPPFGTGQVMQHRSSEFAYDDRVSVDQLLTMLRPFFQDSKRRLSSSAIVYVHLDYRCVHEAKCLCDSVFGGGAFLGEIVWVPGNGAKGHKFSVTHQTILLYARSTFDRDKVVWDAKYLREPFADTSLSMHFNKVDENGRRYRERVVKGKSYIYYADKGRKLGSVWTDVPAMLANTPLRKESTGYPTQKPEKLLERIVLASSLEGQTVADFMCGSGTTLVVAARHGRRFIGGDIGAVAIDTTEKRLIGNGVSYERIIL